MSDEFENQMQESEVQIEERVIHIDRVATVIKGGRRFGFRALVAVGDGQGNVGVAVGKARGVPEAIRKAVDRARKNMVKIPLTGRTIPHAVETKFGGAKVLLKPASPGTGVIAGTGVRAVLEVAGIRDVLSKSLGGANAMNVVYATMQGLRQLRDVETVAKQRGKNADELRAPWEKQRV